MDARSWQLVEVPTYSRSKTCSFCNGTHGPWLQKQVPPGSGFEMQVPYLYLCADCSYSLIAPLRAVPKARLDRVAAELAETSNQLRNAEASLKREYDRAKKLEAEVQRQSDRADTAESERDALKRVNDARVEPAVTQREEFLAGIQAAVGGKPRKASAK